MDLGKHWEMVRDREAWWAAVRGVTESWTWGATQQQQQANILKPSLGNKPLIFICIFLYCKFDHCAVLSCSTVSDSATLHTAACQSSLSLTISQSLPKFTFIELVMPSSHLILWHSLLLLPFIFPGIREFSSESSVCIRWPNYWSFSFSISSSSE